MIAICTIFWTGVGGFQSILSGLRKKAYSVVTVFFGIIKKKKKKKMDEGFFVSGFF